MPNGGSDCCGTCRYNSVYSERARSARPEQLANIRCQLRDFVPDDPFWTYCANHPHHNTQDARTPVGPVYASDGLYGRVEKLPAPDQEQVRLGLVDLAMRIPQVPEPEYPGETSFSVEIIKHISHLREVRALPAVFRILSFDPFATSADEDFPQNNLALVSQALECLPRLIPDGAAAHLRPWIGYGLDALDTEHYDPAADPCAPLRYHAVRALRDAQSAEELLKQALQDPHPEIRAFALGIGERKRRWPFFRRRS